MVWAPFILSILFSVLFILIEIYIAVEPILPISLLTQKVPVLVGFSNALVAVCNLSVTYYFPTWFQTVMLTSASTAGKEWFHLRYIIVLYVIQDCISFQIVFVSLEDLCLQGNSPSFL